MDEIGDAIDAIPGLNVYRYPADSISPPAAVVQFPTVNYDRAFQRGTDTMDGGIAVLVSRVWDRAARDTIARYVGGDDSPESIHAAIHAYTTGEKWTSCSFVRVVGDAAPQSFTVAGTDFAGYQIDLQIAGPGS